MLTRENRASPSRASPRALFLSLFSLKKKREQNLPANTSWANSLGCGPEACSAVADTTLERTLVAPPEGDEELVDDELGADGVVVVVAADDVEAPFLIAADVFRRGAATARATIVPRLAGSGAAALPLVVATVTKQLCELVRAKDAMFQRRRRRREGEKESASCLVFFLLLRRRVEESERERREREREKTRSRSSSTSSFFVATSTTTSSSTPSTADPLNRIPSLSLSFLCNTKHKTRSESLSQEQKQGRKNTKNTIISLSFLLFFSKLSLFPFSLFSFLSPQRPKKANTPPPPQPNTPPPLPLRRRPASPHHPSCSSRRSTACPRSEPETPARAWACRCSSPAGSPLRRPCC